MAQFNLLSNREREVVNLLLQGKSNKLIASSLGVSVRTVEFHLTNIYAKFHVSSRTELILKLGNATGQVEIEKLGYSTVDSLGESVENGDALNSRTDWVTSFRDTVSIIDKELEMKNLLSTKHTLVGVVTAIFTGFLWVALLQRFGHMSLNEIAPWIVPLVVTMAIIGLSVGFVGKRNSNTLGQVFFSTLFGTGLGAFAMIPLMGFVIYPFGKLAEWLGLINRSAISTDVTTMLVIVTMIATWLIVGIAIGVMLLIITIKKPTHADIQRHATATEHGS